MVKTLERALAEVATLPEAAQEQIGQELLAHLAKIRALQSDLEEGIASLESGNARALEVKDVLARARERHGKP